MANVITIANQKGGVGKTTTAVCLAIGLHLKGYKTLLIDTDPQCNSTDTYKANYSQTITLYDVLQKEETIEKAVQQTEYGHIIASDPLLSKADIDYNSTGREYLLKESLDAIRKQYEYIIIDTSPSLGILLINALSCSDKVIIPILADRYSLQGLNSLNDTIQSTKKYTNPNLEILGLLLTMYQGNTYISKEVMSILPQFEKLFNTKTFNTKIRLTTKVKEATGARTPLLIYDKKSTAAEDYNSLVEEIERELQQNGEK